MFAYRLAAHLGWFNVDAMLASGQPLHLYEWQEYEQLEPFGNDWHRSSVCATRTINTIGQLAAGMGGQPMQESEFIDDDAFVPKRRDENDTPERRQLEKAADILEGMRGF